MLQACQMSPFTPFCTFTTFPPLAWGNFLASPLLEMGAFVRRAPQALILHQRRTPLQTHSQRDQPTRITPGDRINADNAYAYANQRKELGRIRLPPARWQHLRDTRDTSSPSPCENGANRRHAPQALIPHQRRTPLQTHTQRDRFHTDNTRRQNQRLQRLRPLARKPCNTELKNHRNPSVPKGRNVRVD